jgi:hypothetical protein
MEKDKNPYLTEQKPSISPPSKRLNRDLFLADEELERHPLIEDIYFVSDRWETLRDSMNDFEEAPDYYAVEANLRENLDTFFSFIKDLLQKLKERRENPKSKIAKFAAASLSKAVRDLFKSLTELKKHAHGELNMDAYFVHNIHDIFGVNLVELEGFEKVEQEINLAVINRLKPATTRPFEKGMVPAAEDGVKPNREYVYQQALRQVERASQLNPVPEIEGTPRKRTKTLPMHPAAESDTAVYITPQQEGGDAGTMVALGEEFPGERVPHTPSYLEELQRQTPTLTPPPSTRPAEPEEDLVSTSSLPGPIDPPPEKRESTAPPLITLPKKDAALEFKPLVPHSGMVSDIPPKLDENRPIPASIKADSIQHLASVEERKSKKAEEPEKVLDLRPPKVPTTKDQASAPELAQPKPEPKPEPTPKADVIPINRRRKISSTSGQEVENVQPQRDIQAQRGGLRKRIFQAVGAALVAGAALYGGKALVDYSGSTDSTDAKQPVAAASGTETSAKTTASTPAESEISQTGTQREAQQQAQQSAEEAPVFTQIDTGHPDFRYYLEKFPGADLFKNTLINIAAKAQVRVNANNLEILKTFVDAGVDETEGTGFMNKAFKLYQQQLTGIDVNAENPLAGAQYRQLRLMMDGVQNLLEVKAPEKPQKLAQLPKQTQEPEQLEQQPQQQAEAGTTYCSVRLDGNSGIKRMEKMMHGSPLFTVLRDAAQQTTTTPLECRTPEQFNENFFDLAERIANQRWKQIGKDTGRLVPLVEGASSGNPMHPVSEMLSTRVAASKNVAKDKKPASGKGSKFTPWPKNLEEQLKYGKNDRRVDDDLEAFTNEWMAEVDEYNAAKKRNQTPTFAYGIEEIDMDEIERLEKAIDEPPKPKKGLLARAASRVKQAFAKPELTAEQKEMQELKKSIPKKGLLRSLFS